MPLEGGVLSSTEVYKDVRFECDKAVLLHRRAEVTRGPKSERARQESKSSWDNAAQALSSGEADLDAFQYFCTSTHLMALGPELARYAGGWNLPRRWWAALAGDLTSPRGSVVNRVLSKVAGLKGVI